MAANLTDPLIARHPDVFPLAPTVQQLHDLLAPFSVVDRYTQPFQQKLAPYTAQFDAHYESYFGPIHPLSTKFPLIQPHKAAFFGLLYLALVTIIMPVFRAASFKLSLKPVMRVYNAFMVVLSSYMCVQAILLASASNSSLFCVPMAAGQAGEHMAQLVWIFTYSKVIEFLDTVFMVFEARYRQVSFLHVYHHLTILAYWFTILWMAPGSDAYFSLAGNSFIHVLMYGYYLLASFGYSPWWKYYITKMQIFQFCCFCVQSVYVGYVMTESRCSFPNVLSRGLLWYMLTLIALFLHFLLTNSKSKKSQSAKTKTT
ncbi:Elongation of very long chain fatty acids protein 2 [Gracilariopsis chorda]|uniref:Elongation of fatty acids protein n=1 Tax=Gracilariopsis chorda TaxID=448386 RepID=A0A2V3IDC8_9FLOR|nr:Elongation of very long chain fatty acids protein 2 [Gracilariopsis chorda]|eukprot:PXF40083.1 Elongation of very long chain fatty acids protein 2 [Gracilariopsis chorda]